MYPLQRDTCKNIAYQSSFEMLKISFYHRLWLFLYKLFFFVLYFFYNSIQHPVIALKLINMQVCTNDVF